ncbi:MAG: arginine decarboxylase [Thalassobius sp.]|nr:arginine decarboxylase [Thalassovita sp.]
MIQKLLITLLIALSFSSCVAVKEYEKININDPDMLLGDKKSDRYISTFQAYREAAAGANGGKTGGGCGCN